MSAAPRTIRFTLNGAAAECVVAPHETLVDVLRDRFALDGPRENLDPLFDGLIKHVPAPDVDPDAAFSVLVSILEYDSFLGRILTGRIYSGSAKVGMPIKALTLDGGYAYVSARVLGK